VFPSLLLFFALFYLLGSMMFILSSEGKKIVQAPVWRPLGLHRWVDLYASADPVPNGPTRTIEGEHDSKLVWNLGSLFADHTAYWDNRDGFVLRVARVCAETAKSSWTDKFPRESNFVDDRARWRVGFLWLARWSTGLTWLALGAFLLIRHQASVPVPSNLLPSWLPAPPVQLALFVALIALAIWATSRALRWIWSWWVRAEQETVLAHKQPGDKSDDSAVGSVVIFLMAMVVFMLVAMVALILLFNKSWADLVAILTNRDTLETLVMWPFIFAVLFSYFSRRIAVHQMPPSEQGHG
jgi:hypothetical protein